MSFVEKENDYLPYVIRLIKTKYREKFIVNGHLTQVRKVFVDIAQDLQNSPGA